MPKGLMMCIIFFVLDVHGQVHQKGVTALDIGINKTGIGTLGGIGYNRNFSDQAFIQARGFVEVGRLYNFKYTLYGADIMAYYNPYLFESDFLQINGGVGLTAAYEKVTGITKEKANKLGWMAGIKGAVELEAFLSDQVGFFVIGRQAYLIKKSLGRNYFEIGVGVRVFLNNYY